MGIDVDQTLSPALFDKVTYIATILSSFPQASQAIEKLLELVVGTKRVTRATERIGDERVAQRDAEVAKYKDLTVTERYDVGPAGVISPACCAVMVDGGRHQQVDCNPDSKNHWYEYKSAICLELEGEALDVDPMPSMPQFLLNESYVKKLTAEIGKKAADQPVADDSQATPIDLKSIKSLEDLESALAKAAQAAEQASPSYSTRDEPLSPPVASREIVATQQDCHVLGLLIAVRAWMLGMFQSQRKAFVGDGSGWIWSLFEKYFKAAEFVPILDLIHASTYVYASATAGRSKQEGSVVYRRWITWVWGGEVSRVIEELTARQTELGLPEAGESTTSPRSIVSQSLVYLQNQQSRMNYPEYRKQGLPITSAHMESAIKEMNRRIKGSEKFWGEYGAESMLQMKADTLCDSKPLDDFWKERQVTRTGFHSCVRKQCVQTTPA